MSTHSLPVDTQPLHQVKQKQVDALVFHNSITIDAQPLQPLKQKQETLSQPEGALLQMTFDNNAKVVVLFHSDNPRENLARANKREPELRKITDKFIKFWKSADSESFVDPQQDTHKQIDPNDNDSKYDSTLCILCLYPSGNSEGVTLEAISSFRYKRHQFRIYDVPGELNCASGTFAADFDSFVLKVPVSKIRAGKVAFALFVHSMDPLQSPEFASILEIPL